MKVGAWDSYYQRRCVFELMFGAWGIAWRIDEHKNVFIVRGHSDIKTVQRNTNRTINFKEVKQNYWKIHIYYGLRVNDFHDLLYRCNELNYKMSWSIFFFSIKYITIESCDRLYLSQVRTKSTLQYCIMLDMNWFC